MIIRGLGCKLNFRQTLFSIYYEWFSTLYLDKYQQLRMFLKFGLKILFLAAEIILGFYSLLVSDSLLMKFLFFAVTAGIIAFIMVKLINKITPQDEEYILDEEQEF